MLLDVESHWQSPCSVFAIFWCLYTVSVCVGIAPTIKQMFCLLLPLFAWGLRLTSEVSPTDLLVNCAITRSTKMSISCHISNVDYNVCKGPPSFCNSDLLACVNGMDLYRQSGFVSGMVRELLPLGKLRRCTQRIKGRKYGWMSSQMDVQLEFLPHVLLYRTVNLRGHSRCSGGKWAAHAAR